MSELSPEAEAALRRLDEQVAEAQRKAEVAQKLQVEIERVRETVSSTGQEVSVEVDALGRVQRVDFRASALSLSPADLGRIVTRTIHEAHAKAGQSVMAKIEDAFGADSATTAALRETYLPNRPEDQVDERRKSSGGPTIIGGR